MLTGNQWWTLSC